MVITRAQRARLGLFVLCTAAIVALFVLLVAGRQGFHRPALYRVRFREGVSGLEPSAPVRYQGLQVGHVGRMQVAKDDARLIEVTLALDSNVPLYVGTLAQLDLSGLTGLKAVNLVPGDPRGSRLAAGALIDDSPTGFGHLADNAAAVIANVRAISDQLGAFVTPANRERFSHLVGGVDELVGHVNRFLAREQNALGLAVHEFAETTHAMGEAAKGATELIADGRRTLSHIEEELTATLKAMREPFLGANRKDVEKTLESMHQASRLLAKRLGDQEAGNAIAAVGESATRITHLVQDVDLAVRAGREDFAKSLSYLRQAAEDLREFSRILAQNPSVLVRGRNNAD